MRAPTVRGFSPDKLSYLISQLAAGANRECFTRREQRSEPFARSRAKMKGLRLLKCWD